MKILVINNSLKERHKSRIRETAAAVGAQVCFTDTPDDIPEGYADPDVVYGFAVRLAAENKDLKWLCVPFAGVDVFLKPDSFANKDCLFSYSSGAYGVSIAEHIIAVSLMMMRKLTEHHALSINGRWGSPVPQRSLYGCRITCLGTGDIGSAFARRARAFEPAGIIGISRSGKSKETAYDKVYTTDRLDEVLPDTDLLVMSLPDTPLTRGILSRERIDLLPEGAYVVNVGRGSAIDEDALADALDSGKLAGAALDVFSKEPVPSGSRLWNTKNLLITPHVAGNLTLDHTADKNVEMFCEDLMNFAEGRPLRYEVDRNRGY